MKYSSIILFTLFSLSATAGFEGKQDGRSLKVFNKIDCSTGMTCTRTGNGDFTITADASGALGESDVEAVSEGLNLDRTAVFDFDFAVSGGVSGSYTTGVNFPAKTVVEKCWFRVETQFVDAGAGTVAVGCEDAGNILAAADITGSADGAFLAAAPIGTAATMVDDIAASCDITYVIGGVNITAGKIRGWCRYSVHE